MSEGRRPTLLAYLQRLWNGPEAEDSDARLLERFARERDESAFASLMRRHGPLVWGVCRRVLAQEQAAEDAFQATFLVLARKARAVRKSASVRSWLYGVALKVAVRARQREALRRLRERNAPSRPAVESPTEVGWQEVRSILDEEIQRLPERYRLPVILCYLEGQTNDEAARQLNCPRGTIAVRLSRARERLRARLIRRGLTLSAMAFTAMLSESASTAAVPPMLISQTANAALTGAASSSIAMLTEGVIRAMFVTKLKMTFAGLLALVVVGSAGVCAFSLLAQPPAPEPQEKDPLAFPEKVVRDKPAPVKSAEELRKLLEQRRTKAEQEAKVRYDLWRVGADGGRPDQVIESSKQLLRSELDLAKTKADRLTAHERHFQLLNVVEKVGKRQFDVGRLRQADYLHIEYERLDAEISLEREKSQK